MGGGSGMNRFAFGKDFSDLQWGEETRGQEDQ